jgi:peptidoglycan hydrolase-like protein with peptidoglycan-binding domain
MSQSIKTSLDKIRLLESQQLSEAPAMAAPAAKVAGKGVGRFIPGVGAAIGAYDAYNRAKQGDWTGAGLSALGGAASLVPGVGTAASIGIAGAQALRDKQRTGSYLPGDDEIAAGVAKDKQAQPAQATAAPTAKVPPGGDPKVFALQQQLIAKGAKISADGKMGPATQAAMKQFPGVQMASKINNPKGKIMSESDKIAALRARLEQIDNQQVNEGPLDALAKFGKGISQGFKNPGVVNARGMQGAQKAGAGVGGTVKGGVNAVKANPVKTALATGAAGAAAGYMAGKPGAAAPAAKPPVGGKPAAAAPAAGGQTANAGPDPKDVEALNAMADELQNSQDPVDIELMKQYNGIINAINNRAKDDKRTQGEIAASAALGDMQ